MKISHFEEVNRLLLHRDNLRSQLKMLHHAVTEMCHIEELAWGLLQRNGSSGVLRIRPCEFDSEHADQRHSEYTDTLFKATKTLLEADIREIEQCLTNFGVEFDDE